MNNSELSDKIIGIVNDSKEYLHASMNLDGIKVTAVAARNLLEFRSPDQISGDLDALLRLIENIATETDEKLSEFTDQIFNAANTHRQKKTRIRGHKTQWEL